MMRRIELRRSVAALVPCRSRAAPAEAVPLRYPRSAGRKRSPRAVLGSHGTIYWIPILIIAAVCVIGVAWSPIFALIIALPALLAFFAYVGLTPRADETETGTAAQEDAPRREDSDTGMWGERRA